jgi:predicted Zn-dependent protease
MVGKAFLEKQPAAAVELFRLALESVPNDTETEKLFKQAVEMTHEVGSKFPVNSFYQSRGNSFSI